ncbi:MAG TPA: DUF3187 family protein [Chthonomonadales bacterium]|nr:DUF3187 family protein [Chthonomonadales bacterium]
MRYRIKTPWLLLLSLLSSLLLSGKVQADNGFAANPAYRSARGPIPTRNGRPYSLLFLQFFPESPDTLREGNHRFDLQLDVFNNMLVSSPMQGATVLEDHEIQRLRLTWRRGLNPHTELAVFVPILWRNGGFLDEIIRNWHSFLGIRDPGGRDISPDYRSILRATDAAGNTLVDKGNAFGLGEVLFTLKYGLTNPTPRAHLAVRLGLKLPTGNSRLLLGSGGPDAGLSLDGRYNVGREFIFFANVGGILMAKATKVPNPRRAMFQYFLGVEYRPNNRDSFLLQVEGTTLATRTGNRLADRLQSTGTFGYKRVLDRHLVLVASFSENGDISNFTVPPLGDIGPDFTVTLGLEWHP